MHKLPSRRPMVEQLETRTTPAVTASLSAAGVLTFIGDSNNGGDYVNASDDGAGNISAFYGNFISGPNNFATFSGVKKVVTTFAGNDQFSYDYTGANGGIHTTLDVTLGGGNDSCIITSPCPYTPFGNPVVDQSMNITVRAGDINNQGSASDSAFILVNAINDVDPGVNLNVKLYADPGSDTLEYAQYGGIGAGATVNLLEKGGSGQDFLFANINPYCTGQSTLDGQFHWNLDAGSGNNSTVEAIVNVTGGSAAGVTSSVHISAGTGTGVTVIYSQTDPTNTVLANLHGNQAGDTAFISIGSGNAPSAISGFPGGVFDPTIAPGVDK